jgi:protein gp37
MRRFITDRYGRAGVPSHFWLGATCEDNRVRRVLDILRGTKDRVGDFTAFTLVEPIIAPCDEIDLTGIDWVLTGGESGPRARPMKLSGWNRPTTRRCLLRFRYTSSSLATRATIRWCSAIWPRV